MLQLPVPSNSHWLEGRASSNLELKYLRVSVQTLIWVCYGSKMQYFEFQSACHYKKSLFLENILILFLNL